MNKLYVLCGVSGAGKSTMISALTSKGYCSQVTKFSTRQPYGVVDDIVSVLNENAFPSTCDIIYGMYGNLYAISSDEIKRNLKKDNQIVAINCYNSLKRLKQIFGKQLIVIYLMSTVSQEDMLAIYIKRYGVKLDNDKKSTLVEIVEKCRSYLQTDDFADFASGIVALHKKLAGMLYHRENFDERIENYCFVLNLTNFNKSFETFRKICYNQVGDFHLTNLTKAGIIL